MASRVPSNTVVNENVTKNCTATPSSSKNVIGWQQVFTNVDSCCKSYNRMVQNRAASSPAQTAANGGVAYRVSGKIDRNYNHNYRQYLKKRCMLSDSDTRKSAAYVFDFGHGSIHVGEKPCCTTDCSGGTSVTTYKRSNWGFRKQGAVDNDIYISKKGIEALNSNQLNSNQPCPCSPCICQQVMRGDPDGGEPAPGETIIANPSGATGTVFSVTSVGLGAYDFIIHLDDCENPILSTDTTVTFSGGVIITAITSVSEITAECDDGVPVRNRYPPRDPRYDPKSYNHGRYVTKM